MFQQHNIITAIEIGTSKICVLIGEISSDEKLVVIGFGESSSNNSVMKGEIIDMDTAREQLSKAVSQADNSSNRMMNDSSIIAISITGTSIFSYQETGTVFINNDEHRIDDKLVAAAIQNAQLNNIPNGRQLINSSDSYFELDGHRRVRNPIDMSAHKLEVCIHTVQCETSQIDNFYSLLHDVGIDDEPVTVFSGIASAYGVLTEQEKESGVLLLDMGAGTCEYIVIFNMGILASGVLPIGFEHLANDLSLGLDLPISECRKLLEDNTIAKYIQQTKAFIEIKTSPSNIREIPLSSFETIIDLRLRETFQIIHEKLITQNVLQTLNLGAVLTGGGALFPHTSVLFSEVFEFPVRIGQPLATSETINAAGIETPRYSTLWGILKFAEELNQIINSKQKNSLPRKILDTVDNAATHFLHSVVNIFKSLKL